MFFPKQGQYQDVVRAKQFCAECEVQRECLTANIDEDDGVYGGTSGRQRKEMRRAIKRAERGRQQSENRSYYRNLTAQAEPWEEREPRGNPGPGDPEPGDPDAPA
jgi:hypothetical protein